MTGGRWSHICGKTGNAYMVKVSECCAVCGLGQNDGDDLGHHGPKDRDRTGPGAAPRRPTGDCTVNLRDDVEMRLFEFTLNGPHPRPDFYELADAILALVKAHLTSDEAVERGVIAAWTPRNAFDVSGIIRAAILAALGEGE